MHERFPIRERVFDNLVSDVSDLSKTTILRLLFQPACYLTTGGLSTLGAAQYASLADQGLLFGQGKDPSSALKQLGRDQRGHSRTTISLHYDHFPGQVKPKIKWHQRLYHSYIIRRPMREIRIWPNPSRARDCNCMPHRDVLWVFQWGRDGMGEEWRLAGEERRDYFYTEHTLYIMGGLMLWHRRWIRSTIHGRMDASLQAAALAHLPHTLLSFHQLLFSSLEGDAVDH